MKNMNTKNLGKNRVEAKIGSKYKYPNVSSFGQFAIPLQCHKHSIDSKETSLGPIRLKHMIKLGGFDYFYAFETGDYLFKDGGSCWYK